MSIWFLMGLSATASIDEDQVADRAEARSALISAGQSEVKAAAAVEASGRVALVPELELSFGYERIGGFDLGGFPGPDGALAAVDIPLDRWAARATVSYGLVSVLLGRLQALQSLQSIRAARELDLETTRLDVRLEAKRRFHRFLAATETASVAETSLRLARAQLQRVKARVDAGEATRADLAAARSRLEARRAERVQAATGLSKAGTLLRTWVGIDELGGIEPPPGWIRGRRATLLKASEEALVNQAMRGRPEGRALSALEAAERARAASFWGDMLPDLQLSASYLQANPNPNTIPPVAEWDDSYVVGAQLVWSLERALVGTAQKEEANAARERLGSLRADLMRRIEEEIRNSAADLSAAEAVLVAAESRVEASETAFEARNAAFEVGRATLDELLDADLELARARLQVVEAAAAHHLARARLERALGRRSS